MWKGSSSYTSILLIGQERRFFEDLFSFWFMRLCGRIARPDNNYNVRVTLCRVRGWSGSKPLRAARQAAKICAGTM